MKIFSKRYYRRSFFLLMLFLLFSGCSSDREFKFTFNRKDGETYVQRVSISRERHMSPTDIQMDDTLSITRVTCRKTEQGWDIDSQPKNRTMMRNGKQINNPLLDLMSEFIITYRVDKKGDLKDVIGYEKVLEAIDSRYPREMAERITSSLDIDTLKQREFSEWSGRIGNFIDREFSIGDVWEFETPFSLPNGVDLTYKVKTHFKELVQHNNIQCVLIEQTYDSTGRGLSDLMNDVAESVPMEGGNKTDQPLKAEKITSSIKGKVTRLMDPSTMNIYREESERTILMEMDVQGVGSIPAKITETRSYEYEYQ